MAGRYPVRKWKSTTVRVDCIFLQTRAAGFDSNVILMKRSASGCKIFGMIFLQLARRRRNGLAIRHKNRRRYSNESSALRAISAMLFLTRSAAAARQFTRHKKLGGQWIGIDITYLAINLI